MPEISTFQMGDMLALGSALRSIGSGCGSMEEVSRRIVQHVRNELTDATGTSALVLARLYKTHRFGDLDAALQSSAVDILGGRTPEPDTRCLVLLATAGAEPEWNSRHDSRGHKAIPLPDTEFVARLPMVAEVFRQLGLEPSALLRPESGKLLEMERRQCDVFLVDKAEGSPFIPAQTDFVLRHKVQSVLAFGGVFPNGDLFTTLLFSKVPVSRATADLFGPLALNLKLALLPFYQRRVFS